MPVVEVELPERTDSQIDHLVQQGDFVNRDQAHDELLTLGLMAYDDIEEWPAIGCGRVVRPPVP